MKIITSIADLRAARAELSGSVGFVPTMGFLHEGHLALMREASRRAEHLVVSIFVNPTQFGPGSDLDAYPRDPEGDQKKCAALGCELLFMPTPEMMYPRGHSTVVEVAGLDQNLCGPSRPGHFQGVTTVVTKLFHLVGPDVAVFGQKDYQQLAIIRRMVEDLNFDIEIVGLPTVREPDGLAMSSRNQYLTGPERAQARCLSLALKAAKALYEQGERDGEVLESAAGAVLREYVGASAIDYIQCIHPSQLTRYQGDHRLIPDAQGAVLAMAVHIGKARLIDNLRLG